MPLTNLEQRVLKTLAYKQSPAKSARRLGISKDEYLILRERLAPLNKATTIVDKTEVNNYISALEDTIIKFDEDYKNNSATLEYKGPVEIKSKDDLVRECNIDLSKWTITKMVNNSWGKVGNQNFQVKVWLEPIKQTVSEVLEKVISEHSFKYVPYDITTINTSFQENTIGVLSLQDIHVGKENLDGTNTIEEDVKTCVKNLVTQSFHANKLDKIIFVLGGDLVNMDTFGGTTTAGTPLDNNMKSIAAYQLAFEVMFWSINFLKQYCNTLEVLYIPGNHSRLTEAHIAYALSRCIINPNIIWNIEYAERKVVVYGDNFLAFEHGDYSTAKSFFVFATEFAQAWGSTKYRTCYTGHYHKEKTIQYVTKDEINGFSLKILPSLSKTDNYHYSNKWTGNRRGGLMDVHSENNGIRGTFYHNCD